MAHHISESGLDLVDPSVLPPKLASAGDQALLTTLQAVLKRGIKPPTPSKCSFLETDVGVATVVLSRIIESSPSEEDSVAPFYEHWETCLELLRSGVAQAKARAGGEYEEEACEVLYARAGLLYALLRLRAGLERAEGGNRAVGSLDKRKSVVDAVRRVVGDDFLGGIVKAIIEIGRVGARDWVFSFPPLMWTWHGKRYLGAAHGVGGILHVLWNCPLGVLEPYTGEMIKTLSWLMDCQEPNGNWPTKAPDGFFDPIQDTDAELIQWCHGASGICVFLCTTLRRDTPRISLEKALRRRVVQAVYEGARIVYRHGLLKKGIGICHGVAGSVYALLAAARVLDDKKTGDVDDDKMTLKSGYLHKAVHLAQLATQYQELTASGKMKRPDAPWSLYEGAAGMCCAWSEVLCRMEDVRVSGIPGFDDF
ncbi:lanthionine synthetase C-like protein [Lyophyllum atratum]|nr:lanthionine synthetase C-like protein [Lyophyllum atratum]